ncbi:MAG: hypothetical protein ACRECF_09295 [Methyloceanibacter sp.]
MRYVLTSTIAEIPYRLWEQAYHGVEKLSVPKVMAISGGGGGASLASAFGLIDFGQAAQYYMMAMGSLGVTVSVGIGVLKWIQQRREMQHWTNITYSKSITKDRESGSVTMVTEKRVSEQEQGGEVTKVKTTRIVGTTPGRDA